MYGGESGERENGRLFKGEPRSLFGVPGRSTEDRPTLGWSGVPPLPGPLPCLPGGDRSVRGAVVPTVVSLSLWSTP